MSKMPEQQGRDPTVGPSLKYVKDCTIPPKHKLAWRLVMERSRFDIVDRVLYYENPDIEVKWRIAVPICWRETLIKEAHDGRFGGHFAEWRMRKYYW